MMPAPIAAALREARCTPEDARKIAAFLRALPERFPMPGEHNPSCQVWGHARGEMQRLARAVEAAADAG